ncbi:hypothetical protein MIND_01410700 [Mycena indigotica]|uniref:C2H2-type domain-containing protein n=1 Tax=Mycena indigotica TaxID=2126181 RepID=A0A8H6RXZ0_9AGAR|nr:uncharacterized protein MIND_01410700 [Mycena indigotica]KAF7288943.1 hypothetical protein MIND_01410700 [Mycena indigotica]
MHSNPPPPLELVDSAIHHNMLAVHSQYGHGHQLYAPLPSHPLDYVSSSSSCEPTPPPSMGPKRYRSTPPKFQCVGYGDCRMIFSRSEHLARHIRKHTGERPFTCHCGKQFSRLDNLRQHAQTVHSAPEDRPLNERMMRALAGINASMMAGVRRRRYGNGGPATSPSSPLPMMYSPGYASSSMSSSPGLSSSGSSCASPALSNAPFPYEPESGHAVFAAYTAGYPSGSHSLPASPSYPSFQSQYTSHSPYPPHQPQSAPAFEVEASDYLAAGAIASQVHGHAIVKQEEVDLGLDLDEFYRAVCGSPSDFVAGPGYDCDSSSSPSPPQSPEYYSNHQEREMTNAEYYRAVQAEYYSQQPQAAYAFAS